MNGKGDFLAQLMDNSFKPGTVKAKAALVGCYQASNLSRDYRPER